MKPERLQEIQEAWRNDELTDLHIRDLVTAVQGLHLTLERELATYSADVKNPDSEYEWSEYYRRLGRYALAEEMARLSNFRP